MFEFMDDLVGDVQPPHAPLVSQLAPAADTVPPASDLTSSDYRYHPTEPSTIDLYGMTADISAAVDQGGAGGAPSAPQGGHEGAGGTSGSTTVPAADPVQQIIDRHMNAYSDLPFDQQLEAALFGSGRPDAGVQPYRRKHDPDNQNTDLAAADHYLFARSLPNQIGSGVSKGLSGLLGGGAIGNGIGNFVGGGLGALGGVATMPLVAGYDAYKAVGHGLKDHNVALGAAACLLPGLLPLGLASMLVGDHVGDGMLKLIANPGETPSKPTLKSVGWGLRGAASGIGDNLTRMFGGL